MGFPYKLLSSCKITDLSRWKFVSNTVVTLCGNCGWVCISLKPMDNGKTVKSLDFYDPELSLEIDSHHVINDFKTWLSLKFPYLYHLGKDLERATSKYERTIIILCFCPRKCTSWLL